MALKRDWTSIGYSGMTIKHDWTSIGYSGMALNVIRPVLGIRSGNSRVSGYEYSGMRNIRVGNQIMSHSQIGRNKLFCLLLK